jgi:hypothetical protein
VTHGGEKNKLSEASQFILFVKYYQGDKIIHDEIGGTCSTSGLILNPHKHLAIKPEAKSSSERPWHKTGKILNRIL